MRVPPLNALRRSIFGLPLLHPRCGAALCWFGVMLLFDCVFTAFWTPVNVAFCLDQYGRLGAPCTRTDLAGGRLRRAAARVGWGWKGCGAVQCTYLAGGRQHTLLSTVHHAEGV